MKLPKKKDHRGVRQEKTGPHLCIVWFHWSKWPRIYIHSWSSDLGEMRYTGILHHKGDGFVGINGCQK